MNFELNNTEPVQDIKYVIWKNNEEYKDLVCSSCSKLLVKLVEIPNGSEDETIYQAVCPKCKSNSFIRRMTGRVIYIPHDDVSLVDVITEGNKVNLVLGVVNC